MLKQSCVLLLDNHCVFKATKLYARGCPWRPECNYLVPPPRGDHAGQPRPLPPPVAAHVAHALYLPQPLLHLECSEGRPHIRQPWDHTSTSNTPTGSPRTSGRDLPWDHTSTPILLTPALSIAGTAAWPKERRSKHGQRTE